ncbi:MAG: preprotein translocase subunit SecE, partial [Coriobacteriia bacterium]|nr:preprotein translocase subunit SecE [Coriobacteriia bacterium]
KIARQSSSRKKKSTSPKRFLTYFKNVRLEIKRTTWPSRNEVFRMSLIVVGALIFFGVFIFIIDWAMTKLLEIYANFAPTGAPKDVIPEGEDGEEALLVIDYLKMLWRL